MTQVNISYLLAKNGEETVRVNQYYLHSLYNPTNEAIKIVNNRYTPHHVHVLIGYGNGYILKELKKRIAFNEKIVVIDPLCYQKLLSVHEEHLEDFVHEDIYNEDLPRYLSYLADESNLNLQVIISPNYDKLLYKEVTRILTIVKEVNETQLLTKNTMMANVITWEKNFISNLTNCKYSKNLRNLEDYYDKPVVVASGGPSLEKQLPLLKKYRQKLLLIASGSAAGTLIKNQIKPDYIVSIDGSPENFNVYKELDVSDVKLIYTPLNEPRIAPLFKEKYVLIRNDDAEVYQYFKTNFQEELVALPGGSTVAIITTVIATYISTGPIALIGQDVAYTDNLTHAPGNYNCREIDGEFVKDNRLFLIEGYNGDKVYTSLTLNAMRIDFETLIKNLGESYANRIVNCTEGGAKLKGYRQLTFSEFLEGCSNNSVVVAPKFDNMNLDLQQLWKKEIKICNDLILICTDGLYTLTLNKSSTHWDERILFQLKNIEENMNEKVRLLPASNITSSFYKRLKIGFLPVENESFEQMYTRQYQQFKHLFNEMIAIIRLLKEIIAFELNKIDLNN